MLCPACGHDNPDRSRFCNDCGARIGAATTPAPSTADPRAYTPRHLIDRILASRSALVGERKPVTVLFADVARSMELAERVDAEEWHDLLDRLFKILAEGVHLYEGTINQYTGDGIMALFGAPIAHEDHAERACGAALALSRELAVFADTVQQSRGLDFGVRIGLNSGEVVVGRIGDDLRMDYTAQGHVVGLAARVQALARTGTVWVTEYTERLASGFFTFVDRGEHLLKGVRAPIRLYELRGSGSIHSRLDRARAVGFGEFVGRGHGIDRLVEALASARSGRAQVVLVVGDAGVGKSRLCLEFVERASDATVHQVRALSHGRMLPFHAIVNLARQLFGLDESSAALDIQRAVARGLEAAGPVDPIALGFWLELLGAPDPARGPSDVEPDERRARLLRSLCDVIRARARRQPLVLWIEDLYWLDPASSAALEFLATELTAGEAAGSQVLLLATTRPEHQPAWPAQVERLALEPLSSDDCSRLLDDWLGAHPVLGSLRERIEDRTRGNPLFVEEIVRSLIESGAISGERGAYAPAALDVELALPDTVQAVIASRIDRLAPADKDVLHTAAVVGHDIPEELLGLVMGLSESELAESLARLTSAEFLGAPLPAGDRAFRHPLTQEVAYRTQLADRRRQTHAAVARGLLALHAGATDERAALLAHHFEEAGELLDAARWHERAGRLALSDPADGRKHCRRVRALVADLPVSSETLTLELTSSIALLEFGRIDGIGEAEAEALFEQARGVAERLGESAGHAFLLVSYGRLCGLFGDVAKYLECAREAATLALSSEEPALLFEMSAVLAHAELAVGHLVAARDVAAGALAELASNAPLAERLRRATSPALCHIWGCLASAYLGDDAQAEAGLTALLIDEDERDYAARYGTHGFLCEVMRLRGDTAGALVHGRRAVELAGERGSPLARVEASVFLGAAELQAGDVAAATRALESALALARTKHAALWYEPRILATLADAKRAAGDRPAARALLAEARAAMDRGRGWRLSACDIELCNVRLLASEPLPDRALVERALASLDDVSREMGAEAYLKMADLERAHLGASGP